MKPDTYRNFEHLSRFEREGVDFSIEHRDRGSSVVVMAPHGGRIEPLTFRLARLIAAEDFSFYGFRGIKAAANWNLHLTSHLFDEPVAMKMARRALTVVTLHGMKGENPAISIGGLATDPAAAVGTRLKSAGFEPAFSTHPVAGRHPANLCNRGASGSGVQLELSIRFRADLKRDKGLREGFVKAVRTALLEKVNCRRA